MNIFKKLFSNLNEKESSVETTESNQNFKTKNKDNLKSEKLATLAGYKNKYHIPDGATFEEIFIHLKKCNCDLDVIRKIFSLLLLKKDITKTYQYCGKKAKELTLKFEIKFSLEILVSDVEDLRNNKELNIMLNKFVDSKEFDFIEYFAVPCENLIKDSAYQNVGWEDYQPIYNTKDIEYCPQNIKRILATGLNCPSQELLDRLQIIRNFSGQYFQTQYNECEKDGSFYSNKQLKRKLLSDINFVEENPIYDELVYLKKALQKNEYIKNDSSVESAFYLYLCLLYRDKKLKRLMTLKEKYGLANENDTESVKVLYTAGYGLQEILEYVSLLHYTSDKGENFAYKDLTNFLKKPVLDELEKYKSKNYLESIISGNVDKISMSDIDIMSGIEFEKFVSSIFQKLGFETEITKASGDQGIDVLATKNDAIIAIQTKCYSGVVGNHAIMEAVGGMKFYNANKCMVITNSTFTKSAIDLARANNVELWDRKVLKEKIEGL